MTCNCSQDNWSKNHQQLSRFGTIETGRLSDSILNGAVIRAKDLAENSTESAAKDSTKSSAATATASTAEHSAQATENSAEAAGTSEHSTESVEHPFMLSRCRIDRLRSGGRSGVCCHATHQHRNCRVHRLLGCRWIGANLLTDLTDNVRRKLLLNYVLNARHLDCSW
jgi:hypothetical protein